MTRSRSPPFSGSRSSQSSKKHKSKHSKTKKRRHRSSSSGSSGEEEARLEKRLKLERQRQIEERRRRKDAAKAAETMEEKRARRLAKKLMKEEKKKETLGWDDDCMGYSNMDNPFGDSSLTETFVWGKKLEKEGRSKISKTELTLDAKQKRLESAQELEKVKKARVDRERSKAERMEQVEIEQREREADQFKEWSAQERLFHLEQAKMRSTIRIEENRAKPIDLLARYVSAEDDDDLEIEMRDPVSYFRGLTARDLEDLLADVNVYQSLEKGKNDDYWRDITIIAEEELLKLKQQAPDSDEPSSSRRQGINSSVRKEITNILKGKTYHQLALLETNVKTKIKMGEQGIDIGYWESLLGQLKAYMAKARLSDRHQDTLRRKLFKLKQEQMVEPRSLFPSADPPAAGGSTGEPCADPPDMGVAHGVSGEVVGPGVSGEGAPVKQEGVDAMNLDHVAEDDASNDASEEDVEDEEDQAMAIPWEEMTDTEKHDQLILEYKEGSYSPALVRDDDLELGTEVVDPVEDSRRIEFARMQFESSGNVTAQQDAALEKRAKDGMGDSRDEVQFSVEAPVEQKTYLWSDKYRPRKPRYFNRVHTGFEWNKYNQTHYDLDNPPPKIVQGYKFNIFYPDLLDPSVAPTFELMPIGDSPDFAILRFTAGPPYEDIAFRVVNREWEISHKKGYRCQFQNGIFQLWYHFKKYRYRR